MPDIKAEPRTLHMVGKTLYQLGYNLSPDFLNFKAESCYVSKRGLAGNLPISVSRVLRSQA